MSLLASLTCALAALVPATALAGPPKEFAACTACHSVVAGKNSPIAPNLWGVGGRKAGSTAYAYSPAMKASNFVWTRTSLIAFITAPRRQIAGTKMGYPGQADPKVAAAIADYLMSLK